MTKMDNSLSALKKCEHLSLSTNSLDRLGSLAGMSSLKILSIGRNNLKKIENLKDVSSNLEQLWMSYNSVATLDGLSCLTNLKILFCSNNLLKNFSELDKISSLSNLKDVLFIGNPMYDEVPGKREARIEILKHLPQVTKIDGEMVKPFERDSALGTASES